MTIHSRTRIDRYAPEEEPGPRPDEPYVDLYVAILEPTGSEPVEQPLSCVVRRGNPDTVIGAIPEGIPIYQDELEGLILQLQDVHRRLNPGIAEVERE